MKPIELQNEIARLEAANLALAFEVSNRNQRALDGDQAKARFNTLYNKYEAAWPDAKRYRWALPILVGTSDAVADKRTIALACQLMNGLDGDAAIDAAMKEAE